MSDWKTKAKFWKKQLGLFQMEMDIAQEANEERLADLEREITVLQTLIIKHAPEWLEGEQK